MFVSSKMDSVPVGVTLEPTQSPLGTSPKIFPVYAPTGQNGLLDNIGQADGHMLMDFFEFFLFGRRECKRTSFVLPPPCSVAFCKLLLLQCLHNHRACRPSSWEKK